MFGRSEKDHGVGRSSSLTWVGLSLLGVGGVVEGAVTGTVYEQRFPNAALGAFLLVLAGEGLILFGYKRQLTRAGLPPNPAFFLWATLSIVSFTVGWANLRGVIHGLDESLRDVFVSVGVSVGLLGLVLAALSLRRWWRRLNQEQQALHRHMTRPWLIALAAVAIVAWVGAVIIHLLVTGQP
jgi:uncharacterized membrane protein YidH (DUF202 family)